MGGSTTTRRQPLRVHLQELRRRMLWTVAAFGIISTLAYTYSGPIIDILVAPLHKTLYYSNPQGGFEFLVRMSMLAGLVFVIPLIVFHLVKFTEPALDFRLRRRNMIGLMSASLFMLCAGVAFGYFVILPITLLFFARFVTDQIKPLISASSYLSMVLGVLAAFGILFQLPLLILLINRITPLTPGKMMKYQRHVIVGSLVIALVMPFTYDPLTQFVIAAPIVVLYELSIVLVWLANRKQGPPKADKSAPPPAEMMPVYRPPVAMLPQPQRSFNEQLMSPHVLDLRPRT